MIDLAARAGSSHDSAYAWSAPLEPQWKLVLLAVAEDQSDDVRRIARLTGMEPAVVASILGDLVDEGHLGP